MFGPDRFHPSAAGYASAAAALLPSVCAALDVWFGAEVEAAPDLARGEGVRPIAQAAVEAAEAAGTEVAGGAGRRPRARAARPLGAAAAPAAARTGSEVQTAAEEDAPLR